jgi:hypothetical protein
MFGTCYDFLRYSVQLLRGIGLVSREQWKVQCEIILGHGTQGEARRHPATPCYEGLHSSGTTEEALGLPKKGNPGYDIVELGTVGQVVLRIELLFERGRQKLDKRLACWFRGEETNREIIG